MPPVSFRRAIPLLAVLALSFLYLFSLNGVGVLDPDEPRYGAIGRAMAETGDWITPRLWGEPWFEKPALLYWMIAAATKIGLREEWALRAPVALASIAFLVWLWGFIRRELGEREAWCATIMLATCAGWMAYSFAAITDLPMSAALSVAVLLAVRSRGESGRSASRSAWIAGIWLGVAVLAKGLVPIVLFLPVCWPARRNLFPVAAGSVIVASPWYLACYWANGQPFLTEFFWRHHFERFFSGGLQHVQPGWYYVPVVLAGIFPWTPVLLLLRRSLFRDELLRWVAIWVVFGLLFFSAATNKLPGYGLPCLPGIMMLAGVALARAKRATAVLAACAALLLLLPVIGATLPEALRSGLFRTRPDWYLVLGWPMAVVLVVVLTISWLESKGSRGPAVAVLALAMAGCVTKLKLEVFPILEERVSVRSAYRKLAAPADSVCVERMRRARLYGFQYYFGRALPRCEEEPRPIRLTD